MALDFYTRITQVFGNPKFEKEQLEIYQIQEY
jgi:hypothetical protein